MNVEKNLKEGQLGERFYEMLRKMYAQPLISTHTNSVQKISENFKTTFETMNEILGKPCKIQKINKQKF